MREIKDYDYVVAGAGIFGAIVAERLASHGHAVLVVEKRDHVAGNIYSYTDEETGIEVNLDPTFRETVTYSPRKDTVKVVVYFIAKAKNTDFVPQEDEISEIKWVEIDRAGQVLAYENDRSIVNKAKKFIL